MGMLLRRHHEGGEAEQSADLPLMTEENEEMTKHPTEDGIEEISDEVEKTDKKTAGRKSGKKIAAKE